MKTVLNIKPLSVNNCYRNEKWQYISNNKKSKSNCITCWVEFAYYTSNSKWQYCSQSCYDVSKRWKIRIDQSNFMKWNKNMCWYKFSIEQVQKRSWENAYNWKWWISGLYHRIRKLKVFMEWRSSIYQRDNFTCQDCWLKWIRLECHHIIPYAKMHILYVKNIDIF